MDIKNKKTALDDNASLYEQNRDFSSKEHLKSLTVKQKFRYFLDYYWKPLLIVLIILIFAFQLLNTTVFNRSKCCFSLITLNDRMIMQSEELGAELKAYLGLTDKNQYVSVEYFDTNNPQMQMVYMTRISGSAADLILCNYDDFMTAAGQGMFSDLSVTLPKDTAAALSDKFISAEIIETDIEGNEISREAPAPYGLVITGSSLYQQFEGIGEEIYVGIPVTSPNLENAVKVLSYLAETN